MLDSERDRIFGDWLATRFGITYLLFFRWTPRERQRHLSRKRQLEALLKELDGE